MLTAYDHNRGAVRDVQKTGQSIQTLEKNPLEMFCIHTYIHNYIHGTERTCCESLYPRHGLDEKRVSGRQPTEARDKLFQRRCVPYSYNRASTGDTTEHDRCTRKNRSSTSSPMLTNGNMNPLAALTTESALLPRWAMHS